MLDPGKLDPRGRTTIDFYKASYDGKHVIVSLSEDGSEDGTAYVYDVATGKRRLPDVLPGVTYPTAGGSAEWAADSKRLLLHALSAQGRAAGSRSSFLSAGVLPPAGNAGRDGSLRHRPRVAADRGDRARRRAATANTCSPTCATATAARSPSICASPAGRWTQVAGFNDGVKQMAIGDDPAACTR